MRWSRTARSDRGFSLVELLVALAVTLLVTGAVFQLMSAGSTAFRREPEIADRQQSIRVAMDRIWTDTLQAGTGMPAFSQVFERSLDGIGSMGPGGSPTDQIGFIKMGECPPLTICGNTNGASVTTKEEISSCYELPALVILGRNASATEPAAYGVFWAEMPGGGASSKCVSGGGSGSRNGHVVFPKGKGDGYNPPGGKSGFEPEYMGVADAVRYRVAPETDGTPALWRSSRGNSTTATDWALIARGIEDLQVQYLADNIWTTQPPIAATADYTKVVEKVRITLSSRSSAPNLQGSSNSAVGQALRGQLTSEVAPRAARTVMAGLAPGS